jgi:penicillin-binding protein 1A
LTGRRKLGLAAAAIGVASVTLVAAAWFASPAPTGLEGRVHARLGGAVHETPLEAISPTLREAVVATEDERYYRHHGVDILGVARALPYDLVHLSLAQGASTITEQVAKMLYLGGSDRTPWRKLEDAAVAVKLESRYTKEQILDAYLNSAYFGEGAYGAAAASERYFGIPPRALDPAQASMLAGLIQAPSAYDPMRHPERARSRQVDVLRSLVRTGVLTDEEAVAALARPLRLRSGQVLPPVRHVDLAPGPAFVWWQVALGGALFLAGVAALALVRVLRLEGAGRIWTARALSLGAFLVGGAVVVRSFRSL